MKIRDHIYFASGILFGIGAILDFIGHNMTMGMTCLFFMIVFCSLGFANKKNASLKKF